MSRQRELSLSTVQSTALSPGRGNVPPWNRSQRHQRVSYCVAVNTHREQSIIAHDKKKKKKDAGVILMIDAPQSFPKFAPLHKLS